MSIQRTNSHKIYNNSRWLKLRHAKLIENPLCEVCESKGRVTLADQVHHLKKYVVNNKIDKALAYDFDNLQSLCVDCHSKIH